MFLKHKSGEKKQAWPIQWQVFFLLQRYACSAVWKSWVKIYLNSLTEATLEANLTSITWTGWPELF
jgi:deoxyadenosine/deoxycytidine kinase